VVKTGACSIWLVSCTDSDRICASESRKNIFNLYTSMHTMLPSIVTVHVVVAWPATFVAVHAYSPYSARRSI
jgi:hypothetical protein